MNELLTTDDIIKHHDTVGTLMLLLCNIPEQRQYIPLIATVVVQKLEMGDVNMYVSFLQKAMKHLAKHGLFTDTSIVYTRNERLKYYQEDLTKTETEQGYVNIWSVPDFLWCDYETFTHLITEIKFLNLYYRPKVHWKILFRFMRHNNFFLSPYPNEDLSKFKYKKRSYDELDRRLHEDDQCKYGCIRCKPEMIKARRQAVKDAFDAIAKKKLMTRTQ